MNICIYLYKTRISYFFPKKNDFLVKMFWAPHRWECNLLLLIKREILCNKCDNYIIYILKKHTLSKKKKKSQMKHCFSIEDL